MATRCCSRRAITERSKFFSAAVDERFIFTSFLHDTFSKCPRLFDTEIHDALSGIYVLKQSDIPDAEDANYAIRKLRTKRRLVPPV